MFRLGSLLTVLALTGATAATAFAQGAPARIRGTIVSFTGGVLTVQGAATTYKVSLPDSAAVTLIVKTDLANIGPNSYIGTVAVPQPDGTLKATEAQLFPEALRGRGEGTRPWDTIPNSSMTNATVEMIGSTTVDKVDGRILTVKYKDTEQKIFVPAGAPIVTYVPGDKSALTPGAHVIITAATKADDGSYTTTGVSVGKDGLVPPM